MSILLAVEPDIFAVIARFAEFDAVLSKHLALAGVDSSHVLVLGAQGAMHWKHSTGELADSVQVYQISDKYFQVGSNLPYAPRRNWGFSGQTDSRGRYYPNDPGEFFMEASLQTSQPAVRDIYTTAVYLSLMELTAGL